MGLFSSSRSSSSSHTSTVNRQTNAQVEALGPSIVADSARDIVLQDPGALDAVLAAAEVSLRATETVQDLAGQALLATRDAAEQQTKTALDFAETAAQPDGGATTQIAMIGALAAVGIAVALAWSMRR